LSPRKMGKKNYLHDLPIEGKNAKMELWWGEKDAFSVTNSVSLLTAKEKRGTEKRASLEICCKKKEGSQRGTA